MKKRIEFLIIVLNLLAIVGIFYILIQQSIRFNYIAMATLLLIIICSIIEVVKKNKAKNPVHFN